MPIVQPRSDINLLEKDNYPIAIVSGDYIYVIYPTGSVSAIKKSLIYPGKIKQILAMCDCWGDIGTL